MAKNCVFLRGDGNGECFQYCNLNHMVRVVNCGGDIVYCLYEAERREKQAVLNHPFYAFLENIAAQASIQMGNATNAESAAYVEARSAYLDISKVLRFLYEQKEITPELLASDELRRVIESNLAGELKELVVDKVKEE